MKCKTCGRAMVKPENADGRDDPRIDCGGDCLWCQYGFEEDIPADVRCTKPRGWPERRHPLPVSRRHNEDTSVEFACEGLEADDDVRWEVEGRFNAVGEFEPFHAEEMDCPECFRRCVPADEDVVVAES